ncbi:MAG: dienelactone hydrolase family protein [Candidatus Palauibacterales bacterium]|nr:dienelactone hydrolase family protein [Candidatus Palauibacterales bacterium]MDP2584266.1 dienelactone hydrolase family protein [Candidatus Palauibacterales bacterium]
MRRTHAAALSTIAVVALLALACSRHDDRAASAEDAGAAGAGASSAAARSSAAPQQTPLPPAGSGAVQALDASPRHGEWDMIPAPDGDSVRAWVVYPERSEAAPVVIVVHEIFGLTHWVRAVADQLAAEGFIAVAPDLLSGQTIPTDSIGDPRRDEAVAAIRKLDPAQVDRRLKAAARWATALPAATKKYGIVGFCWGGSTVFAQATRDPDLAATVVYYGSSPDREALSHVESPVLGLYGGDDNRVVSTVPPADTAMRAMGKTYEPHVFEGAGHGFLRAQEGRDGANMKATERAWPLTVDWFRQYLEASASGAT